MSCDFFSLNPQFPSKDPIFQAGISKNCQAAIIIATNPNTNGIAKKFQMVLYKTVYWNDYPVGEGEKWFPPDKMPCPFVNSYYKFLQP